MAKRAVVIGTGFGGLSVAIRLQKQGFDTHILEKRDKPGGRAYVFEQDGFKFDAGPTVITAEECLRELFELCDRRIEDYVKLVPILPFYRLFWEDGYTFDYDNDLEKTLNQIEKKNPQDVEGYRRFLEYSKDVFHEGYTKLAAVPFLDIWSMVKASPQLIRLEAYRSVYSIVSKYVKDPQLRQAFSFHSLLVGGNPFESSSIYTLIHYLERNWGVHYAMGGTGALVRALVRLFEEIGGRIHYRAEVDEIETQGGKVRGVSLEAGTKLPCDLVVSNADVVHTYRKLLKRERRVQRRASRVSKMRHSMSLFLMYFGTNRRFDKLVHHNVIFGPRYKGLLNDIFKNGVLADDFSLYVHSPSLTDSSVAPEGHHSFYVLSPVPHLGHYDVDWRVQGPKYADRILNYLERFHMPGLKESIVTQRLFTPEDFRTELNSHLGSAFSLEPILTQSAYFRTHNRDDQLKGLYFVGAGTHPGAGVPGVVNSGKATASVIEEDMLRAGERVASSLGEARV